MFIRIGFDLVYEIPSPAAMLLMLHLRPEVAPRLRRPDLLNVEPAVSQEEFADVFGNRLVRIVPPAGKLRLHYDNVIEDSGLHEPRLDGARLHPVEELPTQCLQFLLASRYCEVDSMSQMAWDLFGKTPPTWERAAAIVDWVHHHIEFGYEYARPTKTAAEACTEKRGVCRDFQHLAITLLRAMNIPARYATGYLGDIGVPPNPTPMDFSAWLEVHLGGRWYALDARHNEPRIGRVLMAVGRDATDVALSTSFGVATLEKFVVWTEQLTAAAASELCGTPRKVRVTTMPPAAINTSLVR